MGNSTLMDMAMGALASLGLFFFMYSRNNEHNPGVVVRGLSL